MRITSPAFQDQGIIPSGYTCEGAGLSPPLDFADVPAGAKSLVLLMDDPDVPPQVRKDRMWDHWVLFNISPKTRHIPENDSSIGLLGKNTSGKNCYEGPCPPDREHRYFFKLYALDTLLALSPLATKKDVLNAMQGHILVEAQLMGRYEKRKGY